MATYTYNKPANPMPVFPRKKRTAVDEIVAPQPTVKPMPPAVPTLDQAAPVTTTSKSAVDEIIAPPVIAPQPPVTTAAAGPGPDGGAGDVTTAPVGHTGNRNGVEYFVPETTFDPIPGVNLDNNGQDPLNAIVGTALHTDLMLAAQDAGFDPAMPQNQFANILAAPRWVPQLQDTLAYYQAVLASGQHDNNPEQKAMFEGEVARLQGEITKGIEDYTKLQSAFTARQGSASNTPGSTTIPDAGTGGTGGGVDAGQPPTTNTKPFEEGELTKTPQQKYDDFLKTSPADHPGGATAWLNERNALRDAAKAAGGDTTTTQTEPTGGGSTTVTGDNQVEFDDVANPTVDGFLNDLITKGYELSAEEEATIRRNVDTAIRSSLSGLSARGLGRSSEAAGAIVQGEIAKEQQVGEAKARVRQEGTEAGLKAVGLIRDAQRLNLDTSQAKANYQIASAGQNLEALKNEQNVSFQERALQLKGMETKAQIAMMEKEFGLKIDELEFQKFIQTGELNAKIFDIEGTQRINEMKVANDFILGQTDLEIQDKLGISKLELEKWMAGEQFDLNKLELSLDTMLKKLDLGIEREKIAAALAAADADGDAFTKYIGAIGALIPLLG